MDHSTLISKINRSTGWIYHLGIFTRSYVEIFPWHPKDSLVESILYYFPTKCNRSWIVNRNGGSFAVVPITNLCTILDDITPKVIHPGEHLLIKNDFMVVFEPGIFLIQKFSNLSLVDIVGKPFYKGVLDINIDPGLDFELKELLYLQDVFTPGDLEEYMTLELDNTKSWQCNHLGVSFCRKIVLTKNISRNSAFQSITSGLNLGLVFIYFNSMSKCRLSGGYVIIPIEGDWVIHYGGSLSLKLGSITRSRGNLDLELKSSRGIIHLIELDPEKQVRDLLSIDQRPDLSESDQEDMSEFESISPNPELEDR